MIVLCTKNYINTELGWFE